MIWFPYYEQIQICKVLPIEKMLMSFFYILGSETEQNVMTRNQVLEVHDDNTNISEYVTPKREAEPVFEFTSAHTADIFVRRLSEARSASHHSRHHSDQNESHAADIDNDEGSSEGSSDDCIFLSEIVPQPTKITVDGFIKHKNDIISGDKPFNQTVRYIDFNFAFNFNSSKTLYF